MFAQTPGIVRFNAIYGSVICNIIWVMLTNTFGVFTLLYCAWNFTSEPPSSWVLISRPRCSSVLLSFTRSFGAEVKVPGKAEGHERRLCAARGWRTQGFSQNRRYIPLYTAPSNPVWSFQHRRSGRRPGPSEEGVSLGRLLFHQDPAQRVEGGTLSTKVYSCFELAFHVKLSLVFSNLVVCWFVMLRNYLCAKMDFNVIETWNHSELIFTFTFIIAADKNKRLFQKYF